MTGEVEREAERRLGVGVRWRGIEAGGDVGKVYSVEAGSGSVR